jgi:phosphonate transport system ATP-binding protein
VPAWRGGTRRFERYDRLLALDCLDRVGLLDKAGQRADTLSGGQQQRVAIARALAQEPAVIIADEPVASLDPQISAGILELMRGICHRDGVAVVCSLHQMHFAQTYADRIVGLARGRLVVDVEATTFDSALAARLYGSAELQGMIN